MTGIKAAILDFDGVLAESNGEKDEAFADFCDEYPDYRDQMLEYHRTHHAAPRMAKFEHYAGLLGRSGDEALVVDMGRRFSSIVKQRVIDCPEVPGAGQFLEEFTSRIPLYISSVTPQSELREIVAARGVDGYVVEAFGNPPHPKPDAIAMILEREALAPEQVVFVGDSASDYEAASGAGLRFLGRDSGQSFADCPVDLSADMGEVADKLRRLI